MRWSIIVTSLLAASFALTPCNARAALVTFDLLENDGKFDFETSSGTYVPLTGEAAGLQITLTAGNLSSGTHEVNGAGGGLGVNSQGNRDESSQLDGDEGLEFLTFSFAAPGTGITSVTLESLDIDNFFGGDEGTIEIASGSAINLTDGPNTLSSTSELLGDSFVVSFVDTDTNLGNGFSLTAFSLNVTAVPEPSSFALFGLSGLGSMARRRRLR